MPITYRWQAPLQAPSSSASRGDYSMVATGLLGDLGRGVKILFSGSPQWSMEGDLRATSLKYPSALAGNYPPFRQLLCVTPPFKQLL